MSDKIRLFPEQQERVESGPIQFGDDWPGTFIRGDSSGYYALLLKQVLDGNLEPNRDAFLNMQLRGLQSLLSGAIIGPAAEMLKPNNPPKE